ncbi:MAG: YceD family protein [Xanthomonadales bacterium]|jgi:uncharacterized protein|nr:YceD family protein [Xanthomonadales bacterium]
MLHTITSLADARKLCVRGQVVEERLSLTRFPRLLSLLADGNGEIDYRLVFEADLVGHPSVVMHIRGALPLICQRTLQRFLLPVEFDSRLVFLANDAQESELPPDAESLVLDGETRSCNDLVEDELILRVPVVAMSDLPLPAVAANDAVLPEESPRRPFAVLEQLKRPAAPAADQD